MNFKTKVLSTFTRHFSNGSQDFARVQIRFRQADFAYPIFHAIEFDMGDTSDGWPIHFKTSEALHERFKESDRQVQWWELEGEVPADSAAMIIEQATAIAKKYLLPTPQPVAQ